MSRTASSRRARAAHQVAMTPWKPSHAEIFTLASKDWTPPRQVHVTTHSQGWTFRGQFVRPDGASVVLTTRVRRYADGRNFITREELSLRLFVGGKAVVA